MPRKNDSAQLLLAFQAMKNDRNLSARQAGQLYLQVFFFEDAQMLRVHERWLTAHGAFGELGLPGDLVDADIIFHAVKRLFADALEQLPPHTFLEQDNSRTTEWRRKLEIGLAEQRLLGYRRMGDLSIEAIPDLRLNWAVAPDSPKNMVVEIQCHKASRCFHLRDNLLIAGDAHLVQRIYPQPRGELPTCRTSLSKYSTGTHHERYLEEDEEYFFVLVARADPGSFAVVSNIARTFHRQLSPNRGRLVERQSTRAMAHTSAPARATAREGSFSLGHRLQSLNVFEVDKERWYEAKSPENVRAVIGIMKGEESLPQETRKRRRVDEEY